MLQIFLMILWLLVIPFGCGLMITRYLPKEKHTPGLVWINGYLILIALFHCFYLFFVLTGSTSFITLSLVFGIFIGILSLLSIWFGRGFIRACFQSTRNKDAIIVKTVFFIIVLLQIVMRLLQQISDGDDAFYIVTAAATWGSNTMNLIQPYTGFVTPNLDVRHAFSSAPVWLAFLSEMTMVHPAIMGHSVLAPILIILHYGVVLNIGEVLFREKKAEKYIFASMVGLLNVYGYVSIYTAQTFFLTRTWQGKSIFANLFLPFLFLVLLWLAEKGQDEKEKNIYFVVAAVSMFAATAMTTMATFMLPFVFVMGITLLAIYYKKPCMVWKGLVACVPTVAVGLLYFMA